MSPHGPGAAEPTRHGLGDPRVPWVVLLDLRWSSPPPADGLKTRLDAVAALAGWSPPGSGAVRSGRCAELLAALATSTTEPLRIGRYDDGIVLAARHDALDGLALLTAARLLLGADLRSSARGLAPSATAGGAAAVLRRLSEVAFRPPARVAPGTRAETPGDVFAATTLVGTFRTADLVLAGARAVGDWNREHGATSRRTSVAIGASTLGGEADTLGDASAFLRLTDVETMTADQVRAAMSSAPVQPGGSTSGRSHVLGAVVGAGLRIAAPRLGSTLLVSHLGTLTAPDELAAAAFYPVTGGGSGLSLGAAGVGGSTTITLRARAARYDDNALQSLLERVAANVVR
ncbi:MAG: hypothetical protein ACJ72D_30015 [Marmoricola sp.]